MKFKHFILDNTENRMVLLLSAIAILVQFIVFKHFYPYPNFMPPDSNSYIEAASKNDFINLWPIGYSKFLRLFSCFTSSDVALVTFQYLLLQASLLYFLFTIYYFLNLNKLVFILLTIISILNPLLPQISNFISSDALFTSLTFIWFSQIIWIIHNSNRQMLFCHAFIVFFAFTTRYNASYYPLISFLVILFTKLSLKDRLIANISIVLLTSIFIAKTEYEYKQLTGVSQFSAFSGWQLAANALYGYAHEESIPLNEVPIQFKEIHAIVNRHMDSLRRQIYRPDLVPGIYYLWDDKAPLKLYMGKCFPNDSNSKVLNLWATLSPQYSKYGQFLIKKRPYAFLQYYLFPNAVKYYSPPTGFMGLYNRGDNSVDPIVAKWFGWKRTSIYNRLQNGKIGITDYFSCISAIINTAFIFSIIALIYVVGIRRIYAYGNGIIWWTSIYWFCNTLFSIFSAPIELRYQIAPLVITLLFALINMNIMIQFGRLLTTKSRIMKSVIDDKPVLKTNK